MREIPRALAWGTVATIIAVLLTWNAPYRLTDEGFRFLLARTWADGGSLFEHFRLLYLPGEYVWFGGWLGAFGSTLHTIRVANAVLLGLAAALLYLAVRSSTGPDFQHTPRSPRRPASLLAPVLAPLLALTVAVATPAEPKLFAMALVIAFGVRLFDRRPPTAILAGGAALSAGFLGAIREDSAVLLAMVAGALALRRQRRELLTRALPLVGLGFSPWILLFGATGELGPFLDHAMQRYSFLIGRLAEPTTVIWQRQSALPTSLEQMKATLFLATAWIPVAVYLALLGHSLLAWRRHGTIQWPWIGTALLGFAYLPQFLWERADFRHFRAHLPILLIAIVVLTLSANRHRQSLILAVAGLFLMIILGSLGWHGLRLHHEHVAPYPTTAGRAIGASVLGAPPPWAGLPSSSGETLIVLTWGPGWYTVEDLPPGTRQLSTFARHVGRPAVVDELVTDIRRRSNRFVVLRRGREVPSAVLDSVHQCYTLSGTWWDWELWEHTACNGPVSPSNLDRQCLAPRPLTCQACSDVQPNVQETYRHDAHDA